MPQGSGLCIVCAMIPMTKRVSRKRLEAAWFALGPPDYVQPDKTQRLFWAIWDDPPYPNHLDFETYEEYAAAIRECERNVVRLYSDPDKESQTDATSTSRS